MIDDASMIFRDFTIKIKTADLLDYYDAYDVNSINAEPIYSYFTWFSIICLYFFLYGSLFLSTKSSLTSMGLVLVLALILLPPKSFGPNPLEQS